MKRLALLALLLLAPPAGAQSTTRITVTPEGGQTDGAHARTSVSENGRYVAFRSSASNLVAGDTNDEADVFVRDRLREETTRISVGPGGAQGDAGSFDPQMSADGQYVVFVSGATNLVSPATSGVQAFVWDRADGIVRRVAAPPAEYVTVSRVVISADGSRVAFAAGGMVRSDVFVTGVQGGPVRRVSELPGGAPADGDSYVPVLSGDGRRLAWQTTATNLVAPDGNGSDQDVVLEDLVTGERVRANVGPGGVQGDAAATAPGIDASGCRIAFTSAAANLVAGDDGSGQHKAYVRDRCAGTTELVSRSDDESAQGAGIDPVLAADGCVAVFHAAGIFAFGPPTGLALRDRCAGTTARVDVAADGGAPSAGSVSGYAISAGTGRYVTFVSHATNLVAGDTNGLGDVFLRDRGFNAAPTARLDVTALGGGRFRADASGSADPDGFTLGGRITWGSGPADAGLQAERVLGPGAHTVTATVTDADGATASAVQRVVVAAPPPPPALRPRAALVLDRLKLSRSRFAVAPRRGRARGNRGATLSLRLSEPARVTLAVERVQRGRRAGKRCVVGRRRGARCTKRTARGSLARQLGGGRQTIRLTGRVANRALARGSYRLLVSARTADGRRSATRRLTFAIVRAR